MDRKSFYRGKKARKIITGCDFITFISFFVKFSNLYELFVDFDYKISYHLFIGVADFNSDSSIDHDKYLGKTI